MLTFEQIKKELSQQDTDGSTAILANFNAIANSRAMIVEYIQHELLDSMYKQKGSEYLSFMGGTAIRIVYGGQRFSEDLDFDNFGLEFNQFEELLKNTVADMFNKGFELEYRLTEKNAYHCYIKFPHLLFTNKLSPNEDEKILVRIDTVHKELEKMNTKPEVYILNKFNVYRNILVNPVQILLSQKILALIERKKEKGRDFYDVSFLLGKTDPDYEYLLSHSGLSKSDIKKAVLDRYNSLDADILVKEVEPLLIQVEDAERIKSFGAYIQQKM